jgi:arabinogalactan endo-1,4-beta-galactosidase
MGYQKGYIEKGAACALSLAVASFMGLQACGGDSGSVADFDYEVVQSSASVQRDTFYIEPQVFSSADFSISSQGEPFSSAELAQSLSSSAWPTSSFTLLPASSASDPRASFGRELSSAMLPPHSSDSKPLQSSASRPPQSSASQPPSSSAEPPLDFSFYRGADISTVQEYERFGAKFYDVDGTEKDIFSLLKNHGFNAIRLKTFVSPKAQYGYAAQGCEHDAEAYADKEHVVAYAQKVKAAGMAFLLDIHYSDNWADPGKQIIPSRWRSVQSSDALADSIYAYTYDLVSTLKQVNATPDLVQIGNETTPGIMIHVPNSSTNCWGKNVDKAPTSINGDMGTSSGKANAAKYFKAGIRAVKAVSQNIKTVLHIEGIHKTSTVNWWMTEIFKNQKVPADVMGFSAYTAYDDGLPDSWKSLFESLASNYPNLEFIVAEYNGGDANNHYNYDGSRRRTDEMVRGLDRWIGAFFWEPTLYGEWGSALFDWRGSDLYANKDAFDEYSVDVRH